MLQVNSIVLSQPEKCGLAKIGHVIWVILGSHVMVRGKTPTQFCFICDLRNHNTALNMDSKVIR